MYIKIAKHILINQSYKYLMLRLNISIIIGNVNNEKFGITLAADEWELNSLNILCQTSE